MEKWAQKKKTCPSQSGAVRPRAGLAAHARPRDATGEPCALNEARRNGYDELAHDALVPWAHQPSWAHHQGSAKSPQHAQAVGRCLLDSNATGDSAYDETSTIKATTGDPEQCNACLWTPTTEPTRQCSRPPPTLSLAARAAATSPPSGRRFRRYGGQAVLPGPHQ